MIPTELEQAALWWGPGVVLLLLFGYGFLRLAHYWMEKTMEYRRYQMESAFGITRQYIEQFLNTQKSQAEALSRLAGSVEQRDSHDSFEHQEILIALKAINRDISVVLRKAGELSAIGS
ncbi:MAG: hypothetical protein ACYDA9_05175 [Terriglobia bacterium]